MRFIPACAGNIQSPIIRRYNRSVYPRMRGEHMIASAHVQARNGLSPHARGTSTASPCIGTRARFIPACAGNIIQYLYTVRLSSVYPRMRGEHPPNICQSAKRRGLSPHARGTFVEWNVYDIPRRFIPACAGNIGQAGRAFANPAVYPRMRGEHSSADVASCTFPGLSPHARGTSYLCA